MKTVTTVTEKMGSCHCGDCFCEVRSDGAIRYVGKMDWQTSGWIENPIFPQANRPYRSQLSEKMYHVALKRLMEKEIRKIGNAEIVETINPTGICVGDHQRTDYPLTKWQASGETTDGKKVIITYITDAVDAEIAAEHGWDMVDWHSKITKIELEEEDK